MPDYNHLLTHPQLGPTLSATTWIAFPIVGATNTFIMKVSQRGVPINNATVTVNVLDYDDYQVYPPLGNQPVPADPNMPGTYMLTPDSTDIFTQANKQYTINWYVEVPATLTEPRRVLPVIQRIEAQSP
jgi:hypothetical protein